MLVELSVQGLGVIDELALVFEPGVTALTGETGAGKTLLVEAVELLMGGKGDPVLVRPGADECRVEGRFAVDDDEVVLARVLPRTGRSRAYVDGRMAPVSALAEQGARLVDLHGQHAHQSLLAPKAQRALLDRFAGVDLGPLAAARSRRTEIGRAIEELGGDRAARARAVDVLRYQLSEIEAAGLSDPEEPAALEAQEDLLADADAHRAAAGQARAALAESDALAAAVAAVSGRGPFADVERRLRGLAAEAGDLVAELRALEEGVEVDPERLERVRARRQALRELQRKYGDGEGRPAAAGSLAPVLAFADDARRRLADLEGADDRLAELEAELEAAAAAEAEAAALVARARRQAAPALAAAVEDRLRALAMPGARLEVDVAGPDPGDEVRFLLGANPGEPALPLAKVASGGELARAMLAVRLVLTAGPPTLLFDEVDAGIGGEAALAVGRALAALGEHHQVLVVTHLPQVAAFADHQVAVRKDDEGGRTVARARVLAPEERVTELSRMLSGQPASPAAHGHAEELLALAAATREQDR